MLRFIHALLLMALATGAPVPRDGCVASEAYVEIMTDLLRMGEGEDASLVEMEMKYARDQVVQSAISSAQRYRYAYCHA